MQRFLALQVHGSEHGRAALAALREQLWTRGEPSRAALAATLDSAGDGRPARGGGAHPCNRRSSISRQPRHAGVARGRTLARGCATRGHGCAKSPAPRMRRSCRTPTRCAGRSSEFLDDG